MLARITIVAAFSAAAAAALADEVIIVNGEAVVIERGIVNGQPAVIERLRHRDEQAIQQHLDNRRATMTSTLRLQLDKLDRICKLTDGQQKRLRVAAKGAVDQQLELDRERLFPRPPAEDTDRDGVADLVPIEPELEHALDDHDHDHEDIKQPPQPPQAFGAGVIVQGGVAEIRFNNLIVGGNRAWLRRSTTAGEQILKSEIWVATRDAILTEPQQAMLRDAERRQYQFLADSLIRDHVVTIDRWLELSPDQRQPLARDHHRIDQPLVDNAVRNNRHDQIAVAITLQVISSRVSRETLAEFLSPPQLEAWERGLQQGLQRVQQLQPLIQPDPVVIPAVPLVPAAPAAPPPAVEPQPALPVPAPAEP